MSRHPRMEKREAQVSWSASAPRPPCTMIPTSVSMRRDGMSIAPKEFLTYINGALDGMVQIVEALGDERVNLRPNNMPNTNSPFAILTHCVGLTRYFIGTVLAGRQVHRDRDAEFRAQGTVAEIRQAVRALQQHLLDDLKH